VTNQPRATVLEFLVGDGGQQRRQFRFDRLFDQLARTVPEVVSRGMV
jgi:hypothetical protein